MNRTETCSFLNFLCCCCRKKEKRIEPTPIANPQTTQTVLNVLSEPRTESPITSQTFDQKPIELRQITHSKFFSKDIVSIMTFLKDDDY